MSYTRGKKNKSYYSESDKEKQVNVDFRTIYILPIYFIKIGNNENALQRKRVRSWEEREMTHHWKKGSTAISAWVSFYFTCQFWTCRQMRGVSTCLYLHSPQTPLKCWGTKTRLEKKRELEGKIKTNRKYQKCWG